MVLWQVTCENPEIPIDPELFVASQPLEGSFADPWSCLAREEAGRRYKLRVRRIIRQLRLELWREIRRAEALVSHGKKLSLLLGGRDSRLSPLGLYITAHRAGRPDLAEKMRPGAIEQHRCCPLYRAASLSLLPAELYPFDDAGAPRVHSDGQLTAHRKIASLN
jgi:hypothetical protein